MAKRNQKVSEVKPKGLLKNDGYWNSRLLIGTPAVGLVRIEWVLARYGQIIPTNWSHAEVMQSMNTQVPLGFQLADAENIIAKTMVEGKWEWLLFIEHDNVLPQNTFVKLNQYMIKADVPVVGGLYFTKSEPPEPMVYREMGKGYYADWKLGDKVWVSGLPFGCFPAGAKVKTSMGWKSIEDIKKDELVFTHEGRMKKVYGVLEREYNSETVTIKTDKFLEATVLTTEHPILAVKGERYSNGMLRKPETSTERFRYADYKPDWIPAGEVTDEHVVLYKIDDRVGDVLSIKISDVLPDVTVDNNKVAYLNINKSQKNNWIFNEIKVDDEFMRLLGFYLAEGEGGSTLRFSFHKDETEYHGDVKNLVSKIFGLDVFSEEYDEDSNAYRVTFCSKVLGRLFDELCGNGSKVKVVPEFVMTLPIEKQASLLVGYLRGDGHFNLSGDRVFISSNTVSKTLALQIRELFLRRGYIPSYGSGKNPYRYKNELRFSERYTVSIYGDNAADFINTFEPSMSILVNRTKKQGYKAWIDNGYLWLPVRRVERNHFKGTVYNLSVEDDESYTVSGFTVHNCTLIHASIIRELWKDAPEYMVGNTLTRRVFKHPDPLAPTDNEFAVVAGTTDLNFFKEIKEKNILARAGWDKIAKKKHPFLVDTSIFVRHIDNDGVQWPLALPVDFMNGKRRLSDFL